MKLTTLGVVTLGLLPPMAPGRIDPVSLYRARIFDTHPWDTRSWREMSQGLEKLYLNTHSNRKIYLVEYKILIHGIGKRP